MNDILLKIKGLRASVEDKEILKGVDLEIRKGEIHAVMGPNGAGKSTLSAVLAGKPQFTVTEGTIEFLGQDLLAMSPEERASGDGDRTRRPSPLGRPRSFQSELNSG